VGSAEPSASAHQGAACGLTLRCSRPATAGFASLHRRLSSNVRRHHIPSMRSPVVLAVLAMQLQPVCALEPAHVPGKAEITSCSSEAATSTSDYWRSFTVSCQDLLRFLAEAKVVSAAKWAHEYSHVAGGDRYGNLALADGTRLRWMVRPGGLAWLEWPGGQKTYLVSCCDKPSAARAQ